MGVASQPLSCEQDIDAAIISNCFHIRQNTLEPAAAAEAWRMAGLAWPQRSRVGAAERRHHVHGRFDGFRKAEACGCRVPLSPAACGASVFRW